MCNHSEERLDEVQAHYFTWAALNKARALRRRKDRNAWLCRHGRARHTVTAKEITDL